MIVSLQLVSFWTLMEDRMQKFGRSTENSYSIRAGQWEAAFLMTWDDTTKMVQGNLSLKMNVWSPTSSFYLWMWARLTKRPCQDWGSVQSEGLWVLVLCMVTGFRQCFILFGVTSLDNAWFTSWTVSETVLFVWLMYTMGLVSPPLSVQLVKSHKFSWLAVWELEGIAWSKALFMVLKLSTEVRCTGVKRGLLWVKKKPKTCKNVSKDVTRWGEELGMVHFKGKTVWV